jgi:hypothetical protein
MLDQYTYVFAIGTFFAMLDAYNNGASTLSSTISIRTVPERSSVDRIMEPLSSDRMEPSTDFQSQTMLPTLGLLQCHPGVSPTDRLWFLVRSLNCSGPSQSALVLPTRSRTVSSPTPPSKAMPEFRCWPSLAPSPLHHHGYDIRMHTQEGA